MENFNAICGAETKSDAKSDQQEGLQQGQTPTPSKILRVKDEGLGIKDGGEG